VSDRIPGKEKWGGPRVMDTSLPESGTIRAGGYQNVENWWGAKNAWAETVDGTCVRIGSWPETPLGAGGAEKSPGICEQRPDGGVTRREGGLSRRNPPFGSGIGSGGYRKPETGLKSKITTI